MAKITYIEQDGTERVRCRDRGTPPHKTICSHEINQVCKEWNHGDENAGVRTHAARPSLAESSGGEQQLNREKKREHAEQGHEGVACITLPGAVDCGRGDNRCPQPKRYPYG